MFAQIIVDIAHQDVDRIFTYRVPAGMPVVPGMRAIVPFGPRRAVEGIVIGVSDKTDVEDRLLKSVQSLPDEMPVLTGEQLRAAAWMKKACHAGMAEVLRLFVPAELRSGRVRTKYTAVISLSASPEQTESVLEGMRAGTKAYSVLSYMLRNREVERTTLLHAFENAAPALKKLLDAGTLTQTLVETMRSPYLDIAPERTDWLKLNREQQLVFDTVCAAFGTFKPFLLHGVTGSGKTEVYMQAIHRVTEMGKTAIVLVPEISLTPQMVLHFRERLGSKVAILHSALGQGERFDEWRRILTGEARVVIGARSAIFAPADNIGLIIVDEEHETSYLSETHPRYDAIEVALQRAREQKCPVVLGSATPSVSRYWEAKNGRFTILEMLSRANGRPMPQVDVVDMAQEFSDGNRSMFSRLLYDRMGAELRHGNQIMLFLNRRGYASFVTCRACGETVSCENCDVSLTYHSDSNSLRCHYCGYEIPMPTVCPACGSRFIKQFGAGTQKVEEEFRKLFPGVGTVRMDVDTTQTKDAHYHLLKKLADGEAQVLIGTQMIAKGHDFPKVTLVGVIAADGMLRLPDYRSRERTFSLIAQVAGRAGRAQQEGHVVVQTYSPEHFAVLLASRHDYKGFYAREIEERRAMWYPPFARFLRILFTSADAEKAYDACLKTFDRARLVLAATDEAKEDLLYCERTAAPIARLREQYRYQILIKLKENERSRQSVERLFAALEEEKPVREVYRSIEVNPTNLF